MATEGYIKFNCKLISSEYPKHEEVSDIMLLRDELIQHRLIGILPDGIGYGNVSKLFDGKIIISGSRTGGFFPSSPEHFVFIDDCSVEHNSVTCRGVYPASSETLSHAAVYIANPDLRFVVHLHNFSIWSQLLDEGKHTDGKAEYGTARMSREVYKFVKLSKESSGIFAMPGHKEGVVIFSTEIADINKIIKKYQRVLL